MSAELNSSQTAYPKLPVGAELFSLTAHRDERGLVSEIFRTSWLPELNLEQWCTLNSRKHTLRGMSVHPLHTDYLVLLQGHMFVALYDLRPGSPTEDLAAELEMTEQHGPSAIIIPPGVAHGFYFYEESICVLGANKYYDPADELGCHWADPELGIKWPHSTPILTNRDAMLGPARDLRSVMPAYPTTV